MDRVKDFTKIKTGRDDMVLVEVVPKAKSLIIVPDESKDNSVRWDYCKVLSVGDKVSNIKKGDIILNYDGGTTNVYTIGEKQYANLLGHLCTVVVDSDNFKLE